MHNKIGKKELNTRKGDDEHHGLLKATVYGDLYQGKVYVPRGNIPHEVSNDPNEKS